ncbi:ATP-binding cassette domain-containing protein [Microbacteriaceae bacterium VKM Ac-2855]|nr:ATP-binding cassette domain-containing protein [Microbacteriaceae bacterium VKM Ac-2855]
MRNDTVGVPIEFRGLTKRFGAVEAVSDLSATVQPGRVTGFLGPNGAGKTTTLRMLLGLVAPSSGTATFGGTPYRSLPHPLRTVGSALEAASFHPGRSGRNHLRVVAQAAGLPRERVDVALAQVGMLDAADRRVGGYSLGMRQRLGLAGALLGDPRVLVLDEPINGLDPEGIKWIRGFLQQLAQEGRTVLISSHLLSEVQQSVDDVVIVSHGRLVHSGTLDSLEGDGATRVLADSPNRPALRAALESAGLAVVELRTGLDVRGADAAAVGHLAFVAGVELSALGQKHAGLEEAFLAVVGEEVSL